MFVLVLLLLVYCCCPQCWRNPDENEESHQLWYCCYYLLRIRNDNDENENKNISMMLEFEFEEENNHSLHVIKWRFCFSVLGENLPRFTISPGFYFAIDSTFCEVFAIHWFRSFLLCLNSVQIVTQLTSAMQSRPQPWNL